MIRCLKNFSESELEVNQGKEFLRVTSTDPGISISQNRAKIKTAMSWIKNRDESVNNAKHITMTNEVRKLHDRKSVSISEKDAAYQQIVPASTMKLSNENLHHANPKMFRKQPVVVLGHSTFPHPPNTLYSVSGKRKLKEKTHFTEINRRRVTDVNQSSSWTRPFLMMRHEMAPINHWTPSRPPSFYYLPRLAVSPTFGRHPHLVSEPTLSHHSGPLSRTPYFVQNRNGPVIQHFPFYW